jgi:peptide/nickel transport system permease protein
MVGTLFIVYSTLWWGWSPPKTYGGVSWWPVFFVSLLPAWLLVQAGHGELAKWPLTAHYWALVRHLSVILVIRLLKLVGAIIVVTTLVEQIFRVPGLGGLFMDSLNQIDFPAVFGVAWVCVLMVVLVKLAAELIEIAYNHFSRPLVLSEHREEPAVPRTTIPQGWLIFCLVLVFISIMLAIVGPAFAPYDYNEVWAGEKLAPPSGQFWLGTDNVGRDLFSRLLYGVRVDIIAGFMCAGVLSVVAAGWAILAAYLRKANNWRGDTLEDIVMLPRDVVCAFPWLVLFLLLMSIVREPWLPQIALIGSLVLLPRAVGMMQEAYHSPPLGRGWLYGVLWSIPVMFLFAVAGGILYTSSLSPLGWGIVPPTPELGRLIENARLYVELAPWMVQWPSICLATLLLVWVMAGDVLLERLGFRSKAVWAEMVK